MYIYVCIRTVWRTLGTYWYPNTYTIQHWSVQYVPIHARTYNTCMNVLRTYLHVLLLSVCVRIQIQIRTKYSIDPSNTHTYKPTQKAWATEFHCLELRSILERRPMNRNIFDRRRLEHQCFGSIQLPLDHSANMQTSNLCKSRNTETWTYASSSYSGSGGGGIGRHPEIHLSLLCDKSILALKPRRVTWCLPQLSEALSTRT